MLGRLLEATPLCVCRPSVSCGLWVVAICTDLMICLLGHPLRRTVLFIGPQVTTTL
jgi:hypothetical protein